MSYNDEILSHYGITKNAKVNVPDARRTSYGDWSKKMGEALKECGSCMEGLVKGATTGASEYAQEACGPDFKQTYKDLLDAEIKLKSARRAFEKALKCMD